MKKIIKLEKDVRRKLNYAVYISTNGTAIKKAIEQNNEFGKKVKLVISDNRNNLYLKEFYEDHGIEYCLFDFKELEGPREGKNELLSEKMRLIFHERNIDYCLCFGSHLLKGKILKEYEYRIINFHPALLPQYPGFNSIDQAINDNNSFLGNTAHFIGEGTDTGSIILQNVIMAKNFYETGYSAVISQQLPLILKLDQLLSEDRIHIVDGKVYIENANYTISHIYPEV